MKKAQSLIIQFVLFFTMGFTLFVVIGLSFKAQADMFREEVVNQTLGLTGSYVSSAAVSAIDTCKQCDFIEISLRVENMTAGYFFQIELDNQNQMNVSAVPGGKSLQYNLYNFDQSYNLTGRVASAKPITLTFNRTKNELRVR